MQYTRAIWQNIEKELSKKEVIVITGPRRVGKTTTLKHLLSKIHDENKLFLDLENIIDRKIFERENYNDVITDLKIRGLNFNEKVYLALDEIQYVKNIPSVVKYLYDHYGIKFILTGSSSYYLKNYFTESLSGRKVLFQLLPLSFSEFLLFKQSSAVMPDIKIYNPPSKINSALYDLLSDYYQEYVNFGGFPAVALANSAKEKKQILSDIYSSYINQDVKNLSDFKQISDLRNLVSLLAVRVGNRINTSELSSITGLSRQTVDNYIEFLEQTYLIHTLSVESGSQDVKIRKSKKLYFIDTGIAHINADLSSGQKFENTVAAQLLHYGQRISYHENKHSEIDFILRSSIGDKTSKSVAIEAKETPTAADLAMLERRAAHLNIKNFYIIGRLTTEKFSKYRWGGEL
ncbi:MAG: ATP-binding protein [Endomicrobium sp.]|jgi:predicted AAA+ superfamily ATPase|nr:ATP-binding protein [Endomicrobium sp.]